MPGRIECYSLHVRSPGKRVPVVQAECLGPGAAKGPAGFDGTCNNWQNENMLYICRCLNRQFEFVNRDRVKAIFLGEAGSWRYSSPKKPKKIDKSAFDAGRRQFE